MCLIIHKPTSGLKIDPEYIDNAEQKNPDGFGIVYTDTGERITTMDYKLARELVESERPFVAHYRYATRGKVGIQNCHPFKTRHGDYVFSNGTVADLGKEKDRCDTLEVVLALNSIKRKHWAKVLAFTETRFAIVDNKQNVTRYGKWHERENVFYSKDDCFDSWYCSGYYGNYNYRNYRNYSKRTVSTANPTPITYKKTWDYPLDEYDYSAWDTQNDNDNTYSWLDLHYVAVYGTLKQGKHNNPILGSKATLVGKGFTSNKYPMRANGLVPWVYDMPNIGHKIAVEVYKIPDHESRSNIDKLEGHPYNYKRKITSIELEDSTLISAWLYFSAENTSYNKEMELHSNY